MTGTRRQEIPAGSRSEKNYFLLKLIAPPPTFATDITEEEIRVMQEHGAYLKSYVDNGAVIVTGPIPDPQGSWGMAVVEVGSEAEARSIIEKDPAALSGHGFRYEISPMLRAVVRN